MTGPDAAAAGECLRRRPLGVALQDPFRRTGLKLVVAMSLLLHLGAVWLMLPRDAGRPQVDAPPMIEVEMVDQAAQIRGASPTPPTPQQAPPPNPKPAPKAEETPKIAEPLPPDPAGDAAVSQPGAPVAAAAPAPETRASPATPWPSGPAAAVHLGGAERDQDSLLVTGTNVVPPRPDARVHNKPPAYPADAARRHAEGTVGLVVHVTELGQAAWVDVVESSGDESLDRSAQEAVSLWRFQPAQAQGVAVPFEYGLEIRFRLNGE